MPNFKERKLKRKTDKLNKTKKQYLDEVRNKPGVSKRQTRKGEKFDKTVGQVNQTKKEIAKDKAIEGGMPVEKANTIFALKSPEVAYMAQVAGNPSMPMDKVMLQDPDNKKTEIIGGQPRFVRQEFDTYRHEISSMKNKYDGSRMAHNYLGGKGNRASVIPTKKSVVGDSKNPYDHAAYGMLKGHVKDSLTMVNRGEGFKAQQLYGYDLGKDFKKYGKDMAGVKSILGRVEHKLKGTPSDGNYSGQRAPYSGTFYSGGNIPTDAPYLKKNPQEMEGGNLKKFKTKFYRDDQTSGRASRQDASAARRRSVKRRDNILKSFEK
jgi:hypothetical protein